MIENATPIEKADILMSYKLAGKYYNLQKLRGFYINERSGDLHILGLDKEFILTEKSKIEFCKCEDDRYYIRYNDIKRQGEMLLKLTIKEGDKGIEELLEKVTCLMKQK